MGRKNLNEVMYPSADIKSRKNSSGVTASTNFGSGVSGTENENSAGGWPSKKINNEALDPRISPDLKVQAAKSTSAQKQKSIPMSKYISANNYDDDVEDGSGDPSRTLKSNSVQEFLDISPSQR